MDELLGEFDFTLTLPELTKIKDVAAKNANGVTADQILDRLLIKRAFAGAPHLDPASPGVDAKIVAKRRKQGILDDGSRVQGDVMARVQIWGPVPTVKILEQISRLEGQIEELRQTLKERGESA